jgi:hypothetical protein
MERSGTPFVRGFIEWFGAFMFKLSRRGEPEEGASLRQHYLDQVQRVICTAKLSAGGLWAAGSPHKMTIAAAGAGVKAADCGLQFLGNIFFIFFYLHSPLFTFIDLH